MPPELTRRAFLATTVAGALTAAGVRADESPRKARIAISFDLEMSRMYPARDMLEWDYEKGNLNEPTKQYALQAGRLAKELGGRIHYFCVGRVLEQPDVGWLKQLHELGHPIGNHTYDHVNVWATKPEETQFRFQRSPWLIRGQSTAEIIRENIRLTTLAMQERLGIQPDGFRTPGGSGHGLGDRKDLQQMLLDEGFAWVSSRYVRHLTGAPGEPPAEEVLTSILDAQRDSQPFVYPTGLIEIPMSPVSDVNAFRTSRWKLDDFLRSVRRCVEWAIENAAVFDLLCHPSIMYVEDPKFETVKLVCDLVRQAGNRAEIVGLSAIAAQVKP